MNKRNAFLRALVLGGTIVTGFAMNSTDVYAAEEEPESQVDSKQGETENDQFQDVGSLQKMEDAFEVMEGDVIAEHGYLDEASEFIERKEMTEDQAAELSKNGKEVLDQAEEKKNDVIAEYEKVVAKTQTNKEKFVESAQEVDHIDYAQQCAEADTLEEKIDIIDASKEKAYSDYYVASMSMQRTAQTESELQEQNKEYLEKLDGLKKDISINEDRLSAVQDELNKTLEEIDATQSRIETLDDEISEAQKIVDETIWAIEASEKLDELNEKYQEELVKYEEILERKGEYENDLARLQEEYEQLETEYLSAKVDYDKYLERYEEDRAEYYKLKENYDALISEKQELEEKLQNTVDETTYQEIISRIESLDAEIIAMGEELFNREYDLGHADIYNIDIVERYRNAELNRENMRSTIEFVEDFLADVNREKAESEKIQAELQEKLNTDYDSLIEKYFTAEAQINVAIEEKESLSGKLSELNQQVVDSKEQINDLDNTLYTLKEQYEGLNNKYMELLTKYEEVKKYYEEVSQLHSAILEYIGIAEDYKVSLIEEAEAKEVLERSKTLYAEVVSSYENLVRIIDNYINTAKMEESFQNNIEVVQGSVTAEEEYLEKVKADINGDNMTIESADEMLKKSEEALNQALETNKAVKERYEAVVEKTNKAHSEFEEQAVAVGQEELVKKINEAKTIEEKIAILQDAIESLKDDSSNKNEEIPSLLAKYILSTEYPSEIEVYESNENEESDYQIGMDSLSELIIAMESYKMALENELVATEYMQQSDEALSKVESAYEEISNIIAEYKDAHAVVEPDITEVTYEESYTSNISKKVKDIFSGITAAIEGTYTTKTTSVVKTIRDVATNVTKTIVTTSVSIVGSGTLKLYNRFGTLISTISGDIGMVLSWVGGFFS